MFDYIHQVWNYGLGNFINLTPTIRLLSDHLGRPVPVYFDLAFIRDCFLDCEFIEILETKPAYDPIFTSGLVNYSNDCPDYIHAYKMVCNRYPLGELTHTYVDRCEDIKVKERDYTLFIRGSGSEEPIYLSKKIPRDEYYREYMEGQCIFTGSETDLERSGDLFKDMVCHTGDIRQSLALIRDADLVVTNDSGLAHAAGAMNRKMVVLWKNTSLPKNANPGLHTTFRMCH